MTKFGKKYLLFTVVPPTKRFSGGIMLDQLCRMLPRGSIFCFVAKEPKLQVKKSDDLSWLHTKTVGGISEYSRVLKILRKIMSGARGERFVYYIEKTRNILLKKYIVAKAVRFGKKNNVECVWATLQGKKTILSALAIAQKLKVPLITHIWDDPSLILQETNFDTFSKKEITERYDYTIKSSSICATASPTMARDYAKKYGVATTALLGSLDQKLARSPATSLHNNSKFIIGFAGRLYATTEWETLLKAITTLNWKIGERIVMIYLVGNFDDVQIPKNANITLFGYQPLEDTVEILSRSDITYCPYWFDKKFELVARTSFPGKLSAYFAAGRPVLFHGPEYSSPARFIEENNAGLCCYSLDVNHIIKVLSVLANDQNLYSTLAKNGRETLDKYLTLSQLEKKFTAFVTFPFNSKRDQITATGQGFYQHTHHYSLHNPRL